VYRAGPTGVLLNRFGEVTMPIRIPALMGTIAAGLAVALLWPGAAGGDRAAARPASLSEPGPFAAGWRQVTVQRPAGGQFPALLFYPAMAQGEGAPYDGSGAPYPAISFGHGYLQPPTRYQSTLEHLATWGYFVIATKSGLELFPDHEEYAADLRWSQPRVALAGQSATLRVVVTVPVTSGSFDVATVSARSGRDGLTRQFSVTRTKRSGGDSE
jgi:hypothetical protein